MLGASIGVMKAMAAITEERSKQKAFKLKLSLLSDEDAEIELNRHIREREKEIDHQRNLEVANAGRARNFWGD